MAKQIAYISASEGSFESAAGSRVVVEFFDKSYADGTLVSDNQLCYGVHYYVIEDDSHSSLISSNDVVPLNRNATVYTWDGKKYIGSVIAVEVDPADLAKTR